MMNISELLTTIKIDLGIYGLAIPMDNLDERMMDIIRLRSIKTYSQFFPYVQKIELNLNDLESTTNNYDKKEYILPDIFGNRRIIYVKDIDQRPAGMTGYTYPDIGDDFLESFALGQAAANVASLIAPPSTFEFVHPNKLILYNTYSFANRITLTIATEHFDNLMSIPASQWESFEELAIIDVKAFLYGTLKHYNEIQTAHGTINLHIDDWASASQERKELIDRWRDTYHLDANVFYYV